MRFNKYIALLLMLLVSIGVRGQYNPDSPAEPGRYYTLTLQMTPNGAGSFNITSGTAYLEGKSVSLRAYNNQDFKFIHWEKDGEVISTSARFSYTMPAEHVTLVAHYEYAPGNPTEPSKPVLPTYSKIHLSATPSDGGYFNVTSGNSYQVGKSTNLRAYSNYDFKFDKWTDANGKVVSTSSSFNYTVQENDTALVAHFIYAPGSPGEPSLPKLQRRLTLTSNLPEAGSFNVASGNKFLEGSWVWLEAYTNPDFLFEKWMEGDSVISTEPYFNYLMPERNVELHAVYTYDPSKLLRLLGELKVSEGEYIYTGEPICPDVAFMNEGDTALILGKDYEIVYSNNVEPGTATVSAKGILPFFGEVKATFEIQKWTVDVEALSVIRPDSLVWYDGKTHELAVKPLDGMGACTVYYTDSKGNWSSNMPVEPEKYTVSLVFDEGTYYKGVTVDNFYTFEIALPPSLSTEEWDILVSLYEKMDNGATWEIPWDMSVGIGQAETLHGVTIVGGHLVALDLSDNGLTGEFPYDVFGLPYLETLNLGGNALTGNLDEGMNTYLEAAGKSSVDNLTSLNLSGNALEGNVGAFAAQCPNLDELKAAENQFTEVVPALSSQIASVDITGQQMQKVVTIEWNEPDIATLIPIIPSISAYNPATQTYDVVPDLVLANEADSATFSLLLKLADGEPSVMLQSENNVYTGENGDTIYCTDRNSQSTFQVKLVFAEGDANFTGDVDVLDLQSTINFAFGLYGKDYPFNYTAANQQKDTLINVQDVVRMVSLLLEKQLVIPVALSLELENISDEAQAVIHWENNQLVLSSQKEVASLELVLSSSLSAEVVKVLKQHDFIVQTKQEGSLTRVIAYSLSRTLLPVGETVLATGHQGVAKVFAATLADADAQRVTVKLGGNVTGIQMSETETVPIECLLTEEGICIKSAKAVHDVDWKLLNVAGCAVDGGSLDELPQGVTLIPCVSLSKGCYFLQLKACNGLCRTVKLLAK